MAATTPRRVRVPGHKGVYRRPDSTYEFCYQDNNGKTRWVTSTQTSIKAVDGERADVIAKRAKGRSVVPLARKTVDEAVNGMLSRRRPGSTIDAYRGIAEKHISPKFGATLLSSVTPDHIADWITEKEKAGLAPRTIDSMLAVLGLAYKHALRQRPRWCEHNPVTELNSNERPKGSKHKQRILSINELAALVRAADADWMKMLLLLLAFSGLRIGEALALRWTDIDLDDGYIHVRGQVQRRNSSHASSDISDRHVAWTKTPAGIREVKVDPKLILALTTYKESRAIIPQTINSTQLRELSGLSSAAVMQRMHRGTLPRVKSDVRDHPGHRYSFDLPELQRLGVVDADAVSGHFREPNQSDYLFPTGWSNARSGGVCPRSYGSVQRSMDVAVVAAGLTKERTGKRKPTLHDLRHFFASMLIAGRLDVVYVSRQLGHENPSITLDVYSDLFQKVDNEKLAVEALEARATELEEAIVVIEGDAFEVLELPELAA